MSYSVIAMPSLYNKENPMEAAPFIITTDDGEYRNFIIEPKKSLPSMLDDYTIRHSLDASMDINIIQTKRFTIWKVNPVTGKKSKLHFFKPMTITGVDLLNYININWSVFGKFINSLEVQAAMSRSR